MTTHEAYIAQIAALASRNLGTIERQAIAAIKLVYGAGNGGLRGVTYYNRWAGPDSSDPAPFVEVCAFGQESALQIAGTTIHELGHVLEHGAGHSDVWKDACQRLGLRRVKAAGTAYRWSMFEPSLRIAICALPAPDDGQPVEYIAAMPGFPGHGQMPRSALRHCQQGQGTRGGKSRGKGSGSRSRLYHCHCSPPVKLRAASTTLACHCDHCGGPFGLV